MRYLLSFLLFFGLISFHTGVSFAQSIPDNASATFGGGWMCNLGYRRSGDRCEKVNVPANASATFGVGWACNLGYKTQGSGCVEMTMEEKRAQLAMLAARAARAKQENIEGYDFSLKDIERKCEAYVYDREYGELECRGLREIERKCEVYIYDFPSGEIECRGSDLRVVERKCEVEMYSEEYGEISC